MSSRKKLKKDINKAMDMLYTDCVFYKTFVVNADKKAADTILEKIVVSHQDLTNRVSANEGKLVKGRTKAYYKKLITDLKNRVNELGIEINKLS